MKYEKRSPISKWTVESQTDSKWEDLNVRQSYTLSIGETHTMTVEPGVYVLVNNTRSRYGEELTVEDEKTLWVACVREVRSFSKSEPTNTFLLIDWMYRPHELPEGPAPYHGRQELVASTWKDIIDIRTVSNTVDVTFWYEYCTVPNGWYWRQEFDHESKILSVSERNVIFSDC